MSPDEATTTQWSCASCGALLASGRIKTRRAFSLRICEHKTQKDEKKQTFEQATSKSEIGKMTSKLLCSLLLVALVAALQVAADKTPSTDDELQFKGTQGTEDETLDQQQSKQQQPKDQASTTDRSINTLNHEEDDEREDESQYRPRPRPFSPLQQLLGPLHHLFDRARPSGPRPFGGPRPSMMIDTFPSFNGNPFEMLDRHAMDFERQFAELERQAGEGQDVSYFSRNGVAYVKTCTTRRVQPEGDSKKIDDSQQQQQQNSEQLNTAKQATN